MVDLEKVMPELNDKFRIDRGAHHQVIVSLTDTSSSTHFDDTDSVLHVMKGAKRIALAPACLKLELAQANGLKSFSSYDPFTDANVDRRVWKFVDMWEGGSLFLPKNMWHHVLSAAGTMALSINVEIVGEAGGGGKKRRSPKDRAALSKKRRTNDALEKSKKGGGGEEQEEEEEEEEQGGEIEFGDGDMGGGLEEQQKQNNGHSNNGNSNSNSNSNNNNNNNSNSNSNSNNNKEEGSCCLSRRFYNLGVQGSHANPGGIAKLSLRTVELLWGEAERLRDHHHGASIEKEDVPKWYKPTPIVPVALTATNSHGMSASEGISGRVRQDPIEIRAGRMGIQTSELEARRLQREAKNHPNGEQKVDPLENLQAFIKGVQVMERGIADGSIFPEQRNAADCASAGLAAMYYWKETKQAISNSTAIALRRIALLVSRSLVLRLETVCTKEAIAMLSLQHILCVNTGSSGDELFLEKVYSMDDEGLNRVTRTIAILILSPHSSPAVLKNGLKNMIKALNVAPGLIRSIFRELCAVLVSTAQGSNEKKERQQIALSCMEATEHMLEEPTHTELARNAVQRVVPAVTADEAADEAAHEAAWTVPIRYIKSCFPYVTLACGRYILQDFCNGTFPTACSAAEFHDRAVRHIRWLKQTNQELPEWFKNDGNSRLLTCLEKLLEMESSRGGNEEAVVKHVVQSFEAQNMFATAEVARIEGVLEIARLQAEGRIKGLKKVSAIFDCEASEP